jgi:hypothetical protein
VASLPVAAGPSGTTGPAEAWPAVSSSVVHEFKNDPPASAQLGGNYKSDQAGNYKGDKSAAGNYKGGDKALAGNY